MTLTPHLSFDAQAEKALNYYVSTFGGKISHLSRYGEMMPESDAAHKNLICYGLIEFSGMHLAFCDMQPGTAVDGGKNGFSLDLLLDTVEELDAICAKLADGGTVTYPPAATSWSKRFGAVIDKFGVTWSLMVE